MEDGLLNIMDYRNLFISFDNNGGNMRLPSK